MDGNQISEKSEVEDKGALSEGDEVRVESEPVAEQLKSPSKSEKDGNKEFLETNCETPAHQ